MPNICIPLEKAKPGMKLGEDVTNQDGKMVLCRKGTILTESIIQRLENMGIEKILIEESLSAEKMRKILQEKKELLEKAFRNKRANCVLMIKKAFGEYWAKKFTS